MRRRAYGGTRVNHVDVAKLLHGKESVGVTVGIDVGKHKLLAVCRWDDGTFERPWRIQNPSELPDLVKLLQHVGGDHKLVVAMESSGTYGDALRQALADAGLELQRVGTKATHDYAEVFDGVPSQHDGKDAAVVAELAALGKGTLWTYQPADAWEQELAYWVDWMIAQRQMLAMWQGRLEGLLGRHWPEATRVLKLTSATLLKVLWHYGSPQALAADPEAGTRLQRWGGKFAGRPQDRASLGRRTGEPRRPRGGMGEASDPGLCPAGPAGPSAGPAWRGPAAGFGPWAWRAGSARPGDRHPDGVCVVGEHGGPAPVSCGGSLSQSHGPEPGRAFQWRVPGGVADQQTGQCPFAAMAVLCSLASGAEGGRAFLVRGQESAGSARGQKRAGGVDAQTGLGVVSGRGA